MKSTSMIAGTLMLTLLALGNTVIAQNTQPSKAATLRADEAFTLRVGDIFEIIADTGDADTTYSWILTQERTFVQASRDKHFRYRFVQDKSYTLRADMTLSNGERRSRTFGIAILPSGAPTDAREVISTGATLVRTHPPFDAVGNVILSPDQQVVELIPHSTDIAPLGLDVDDAVDADNDGNPENDDDAADTYFHSSARPVWIWIARAFTETHMTVTGIPTGATPVVQRVPVLSEETAKTLGVLTSPVEINVEERDDGAVMFSAVFARPLPAETPLLYEWSFGDGQKSLETSPTHTYAASGTYAVALHVRDLQSSSTIGRTGETVVVRGNTAQSPATDDGEPDARDTQEPAASSIDWARIVLFAGIFVGSIGIGILLIWLLSLLRKPGKLEETLATMEHVIAPEKSTAPPLAIRKPQSPPPDVAQHVIDAEVSAATPSPTPQPSIEQDNAPDWLKKGLAPETPAQASPKTPTPKPTTPATPPPPRPAPRPPVPAPTASRIASTSTKPSAPTKPAPAPVRAATPSTPPTPAPTMPSPAPAAPTMPTPEQPVVPSPDPQRPSRPQPTIPSWLQPTTTPAATSTTSQKAAAPVPPTPSPSSTPAPVPPKPTPTTPQSAEPATKDDDPPIAFIRAESIDPGPQK